MRTSPRPRFPASHPEPPVFRHRRRARGHRDRALVHEIESGPDRAVAHRGERLIRAYVPGRSPVLIVDVAGESEIRIGGKVCTPGSGSAIVGVQMEVVAGGIDESDGDPVSGSAIGALSIGARTGEVVRTGPVETSHIVVVAVVDEVVLGDHRAPTHKDAVVVVYNRVVVEVEGELSIIRKDSCATGTTPVIDDVVPRSSHSGPHVEDVQSNPPVLCPNAVPAEDAIGYVNESGAGGIPKHDRGVVLGVRGEPDLQTVDADIVLPELENAQAASTLQPVGAGIPTSGVALAGSHFAGRGGSVDPDVVVRTRVPAIYEDGRRIRPVTVGGDVHDGVVHHEVSGGSGIEVPDTDIDTAVLAHVVPVVQRRVGAVDLDRSAGPGRLRCAARRGDDSVDGVGGAAMDEGEVIGRSNLVLQYVTDTDVGRQRAGEDGGCAGHSYGAGVRVEVRRRDAH